MRDPLFFALAALVAGVFVFMAMQPFVERPPRGPLSCGGCVTPEDKTISGEDLHRFMPGNFDGIAIIKTQDTGETVLRISRLAEEVYDNPLSGPHIDIDSDLEYGFEARTIEVVIEARSVGEFGASRFEADYMAKADEESGWRSADPSGKPFDLTAGFQPYTFQYDTPRRGANLGYDYFGIRPLAPDKRRVMEVRSIRFHAITPKTADATPPG